MLKVLLILALTSTGAAFGAEDSAQITDVNFDYTMLLEHSSHNGNSWNDVGRKNIEIARKNEYLGHMCIAAYEDFKRILIEGGYTKDYHIKVGFSNVVVSSSVLSLFAKDTNVYGKVWIELLPKESGPGNAAVPVIFKRAPTQTECLTAYQGALAQATKEFKESLSPANEEAFHVQKVHLTTSKKPAARQ